MAIIEDKVFSWKSKIIDINKIAWKWLLKVLLNVIDIKILK